MEKVVAEVVEADKTALLSHPDEHRPVDPDIFLPDSHSQGQANCFASP
jgi:hypothetical protein